VRILEMIAGQVRREDELLLKDDLVLVMTRFQDEKDRGGRRRLIDDMATDANSEIGQGIIQPRRVTQNGNMRIRFNELNSMRPKSR
jgi:hypothetical protein